MKKLFKLVTIIAVVAISAIGMVALTGCGGGDSIAVIRRDAVSGSFQAFNYSVRADGNAGQRLSEWLGVAGNQIPGDEAGSEAAVIAQVAGNRNAIGYASYSSVSGNTSVRMLNLEGYAPSHNNYPSAFVRDFVILVPEAVELFPRTQEFHTFLQSEQARAAVVGFGLDFGIEGTRPAFVPSTTDPDSLGRRIEIRGSTTVSPVMEHLIATFITATPWATAAMFDFNGAGSGHGRLVGANQPIAGAQAYNSGAAIGMSSSGADIDATGITFRLAFDTTVVIVHPENTVANLTVADLFRIYTGDITNWGYFTAE